MDDVVLRRARPDEMDALTALCLRSKASNGYDEAFMAACVEELTVRPQWFERSEFWLAEKRGRIVGCARLTPDDPGTAEIETFFVEPEFRSTGVGRRLWEHLKGRARERGLARLHLVADPYAEPVYERFGFRTVGRAASGSIPGRTLPRMEMILEETK